jgi:hypothetical protein
MRNDRCRLVKSDPNAAGKRIGVTEKPCVLVIVGCASLAGSRQFEARIWRWRQSHASKLLPLAAKSSKLHSDQVLARRYAPREKVVCLLIIDALDDVSLLAHTGIRKAE